METVDYLAFPVIVANLRQKYLLKKKWDAFHYQRHLDRVQTAKAQIDNKPPRTFLHNHVQVKKIQLQQDRLAYIEKDNKLMLERIAQIMRSKGLVDNWNDCYLRRSRNCGKRNRDIVRITMDNQALLKRIQETKPDYEYKKWEKEWQASRNHLKLKIIYPDATKTYPDATKQY